MNFSIDFTKAGGWAAVRHFILGVILYGIVGAVEYVAMRLANWHPGTVDGSLVLVGASEAVQAILKWLNTTAASNSDTVPTIAPDGTTITA